MEELNQAVCNEGIVGILVLSTLFLDINKIYCI